MMICKAGHRTELQNFCVFSIPIFKVFIEFVTVLLLLYDLVFWPQGMWDFSFQLGIEPSHPALEDAASTSGPPGKSQDYRILE